MGFEPMMGRYTRGFAEPAAFDRSDHRVDEEASTTTRQCLDGYRASAIHAQPIDVMQTSDYE
jgi:hypothetical protein